MSAAVEHTPASWRQIQKAARVMQEGSLVGVAPAIANAIFDATGVRLCSMPLVPNGLKVS